MKYRAIFVVIVLLTGCEYKTAERTMPPCPTPENVLQYQWIAAYFTKLPCGSCFQKVVRATYKGQDVILIPCGGPLCDCLSQTQIYSCSGLLVRTFTNSAEDQADQKANLVNAMTLYECAQ